MQHSPDGLRQCLSSTEEKEEATATGWQQLRAPLQNHHRNLLNKSDFQIFIYLFFIIIDYYYFNNCQQHNANHIKPQKIGGGGKLQQSSIDLNSVIRT